MLLFHKSSTLLLLFILININDYCYSVSQPPPPITTYRDQVINITGSFGSIIDSKPIVKIQNKPCQVFEYSANYISCYLNRLEECTNEIKINNISSGSSNSSIIYSNFVCPQKAIIEKLIINYDEQRKHTSLTIAGDHFPVLYHPSIIKFSLNNNKKKLHHESQIYNSSISGSSHLTCSGNLEVNENYIICNSISRDLYTSIIDTKGSKNVHHYVIISPDITSVYSSSESIRDYLFNNTIFIKQITYENVHILNKSYIKVAYIAIPSFVLIILIIIMSILIHKKNNKFNKKI